MSEQSTARKLRSVRHTERNWCQPFDAEVTSTAAVLFQSVGSLSLRAAVKMHENARCWKRKTACARRLHRPPHLNTSHHVAWGFTPAAGNGNC